MNLIQVDDMDQDLLNGHKWYCCADGYVRAHFRSAVRGRFNVYLHRVIMARVIGRPLVHTEVVDHIDGQPLNNRRANMRVTTQRLNVNRKNKLRSDNTSKYRGIYWHKRNKCWVAKIGYLGKYKYLGSFDTKDDAHMEYRKWAVKLLGQENVGVTHA